MKSRSKELQDRAIAAMVAAIEIYNKPGFPYRTESFAILAINGWELLFKAKWLADNRNRANSLYAVSYTHLRAHETVLELVCRLLLEKKKQEINKTLLTPKLPHILTPT